MLRPFRANIRRTALWAGQQWRLVLLTLCAAAIQTAPANALTPAPALTHLRAITEASGPAASLPAAYCGNGQDCPDDEEPAARPSRPYRVGPPVEVPCEDAPLPRAYTYRADPPGGYVERRRGYVEEEVREESYCGIRCWYRRIRDGHCGRGCDYYMFRLRHFPAGRFGEQHTRRVACRDRW